MSYLTSLFRASLLTLPLFVVGCGRDSLATCEEAQERNCTVITNCSDAVNLGGALATNAGCDAELDAYFECANDQSDVCTIDDTCRSKVNAFATCVTPYCSSHLDECAKVNAALGNPI